LWKSERHAEFHKANELHKKAREAREAWKKWHNANNLNPDGSEKACTEQKNPDGTDKVCTKPDAKCYNPDGSDKVCTKHDAKCYNPDGSDRVCTKPDGSVKCYNPDGSDKVCTKPDGSEKVQVGDETDLWGGKSKVHAMWKGHCIQLQGAAIKDEAVDKAIAASAAKHKAKLEEGGCTGTELKHESMGHGVTVSVWA